MITLKRYLLTLVALLAMTTGAWADEPKVYTSAVAITDLEVGDILAEGFSLTSTDEFNTIKFAEGRYTAVGTTNTSMAMNFYTGTGKNAVITGSEFGSDYSFAPKDEKGNAGNAWEVTKAESGAITIVTLAGITYDPNAVTVSWNAAKTEASFAMPAYDATVSYELVRDMAQGVAFSGLPEGDGCILKKDGDKYTFATAPAIALEDNISGTAQAITAEGITLSYEKKGEGDTWVAQPDDFDIAIDAVPGTYRVVAKATTGLYDGTLYSPEFTLAEAYDLTLSPATDANLKSVTVAGTAKTADENGVIKNIEPTKKVKITTTGPDYIIRKAAVKKTGAAAAEPITVTINQSDWPTSGNSFNKDGVTVSAGSINAMEGNLTSGGSFSTTLGNFTSIVVTTASCRASGTGWSGDMESMTWSGTPASSVSFSGDFMGYGEVQTTIVCTIQPNN